MFVAVAAIAQVVSEQVAAHAHPVARNQKTHRPPAMGNRLSKIYTRTGDDGTTGLGDGSRVAKDSARETAYGTVYEANSSIGLLLAADVPDDVRDLLTTVQDQLLDLGRALFLPVPCGIEAADLYRPTHHPAH